MSSDWSFLLILLTVTFVKVLAAEPCHLLNTVRIIDDEYHINQKTSEVLHKNQTYKHWDYYTEDIIDGERVPANVHIRGCFCGAIQKPCIRLCCDYGYLMLPKKGCIRYDEVPFAMNMEMFSDDAVLDGLNVNLATFQNQLVYGKPCSNMYDDFGYENLFKFFTNGSIRMLLQDKGIDKWFNHTQYCLAVDGYQNDTSLHVSKRICMDDIYQYLSVKQLLLHHGRYLYIYSVMLSVPSLAIAFLFFVSVPELRNMYGKIVSFLIIGMAVTDAALLCRIFTTNIEPYVCNTLGFLSYFAVMFDYFWINVLCLDIWLIFSGKQDIDDSNKFRSYIIYACSAPILLTSIVALLDYLKIENYDPKVRIFGCFLFVQGYSGLKYIYIPIAIFLFVNTMFFIATTYQIRKIHKETAILRNGSGLSTGSDNFRVSIFYRLMVNMGVIWTLDLVSWLVQIFDSKNQVFFIVADMYNYGQGFIVLIIFVCNQKVGLILSAKWTTWKNKRWPSKKEVQSKTQIWKTNISGSGGTLSTSLGI